jgi:uncharacterized protein YecE (DUF72 family)
MLPNLCTKFVCNSSAGVVKSMGPRNFIGTSGWSYPHWRGTFYPAKLPARLHFEYYVERFDTVEINASFYNLLRETTVQSWVGRTPDDFHFVLKGSRFVTHMKRLTEPEESTARFLESIEGFGDKLGPLLWQLPPRFGRDVERLDKFLASLPKHYRNTVEFRDPSWHDEEVYEVLCKHNAAFCIYELDGFLSPLEVTADFVYIRLHGPSKRKYEGEYGAAGLQEWVEHIREWNAGGLPVYCYFDNDQHGYAAFDALLLKEMLAGKAIVSAG